MNPVPYRVMGDYAGLVDVDLCLLSLLLPSEGTSP
jgi:hypothetical protein